MSELDEKLNALLSNPESMAQIMQLAQSLSGKSPEPASTPVPPPAPPPPSAPTAPLSSLPGSLDPKLLARMLPIIQELGQEPNQQARQLLYALRPYLKSERQERIERALQLARLIHVGKKFLSGWGDFHV